MKYLSFFIILLCVLTLCSCFDTFMSVNGCDLRPYTQCENVKLGGFPNPKDHRLYGLELKWHDLEGSNFKNADFRFSDLSHSNFKNAILDGADLKNAKINHTNFIGASCINTTWIDGSKKTGVCDALSACYKLYEIPAIESLTKTYINKKYRHFVKIHHPDQGGSREKLEEIKQCRRTLEDAI